MKTFKPTGEFQPNFKEPKRLTIWGGGTGKSNAKPVLIEDVGAITVGSLRRAHERQQRRLMLESIGKWAAFFVLLGIVALCMFQITEVVQEPQPSSLNTKSMDKCLADYKAVHGVDDAFDECVDILQGLRTL